MMPKVPEWVSYTNDALIMMWEVAKIRVERQARLGLVRRSRIRALDLNKAVPLPAAAPEA